MANITHGMNIGEVRGVAGQIDRQSEAVRHVVSEVDKLLHSLLEAWKGKDATEFQSWWQQQHRPRLNELAEKLSGLAQAAKNNANEQEQVSGR